MSHRWRVCLHALDRTGPPVLARAHLRWLQHHRPDDLVEVVAFRGGELLGDLAALGDVHVLAAPHEPWDPWAPEARRSEAFRRRLAGLPTPDATLLVSVSAGVVLPFLPGDTATVPLVTWVVELREAFPPGVVEATTHWLGGSAGSMAELAARDDLRGAMLLVPEFVDDPVPTDPRVRRNLRASMGCADDDLLIVGAGIATHRKAPDLFLEVAAAHRRSDAADARFVWIGGEDDPLRDPVRREAGRLGIADRFTMVDSVADVVPWIASADVFLHPARLDAFPLVCLHAAAAGVPVVAFDGVGGVPEMLGPTFRGAPYPDVGGLVAALAELADPVRRRTLGRAQRERVGRFAAAHAAPTLDTALRAAVADR